MPRSLQEWKEIRYKYYSTPSIPYPGRDSVVYQRTSSNPFWERRREAAEQLIPSTSLDFSVEDTFSFLHTLAAVEEKKEREFLNKFFPKNELKDGDSLTDQFNILFQSRERYERLLQRIKNARARARTGWKGMAPNMDSLYASYLNQTLLKAIEKFRASFTINTDYNVLESKFKELVNEAIIDATDAVAAVTTEDEIYGSGRDWAEIATILRSDNYLREQFITNIRSVIGEDNLSKVLKQMYGQKEKGVKKEKTSAILRKNLSLSTRTASIGGNVIENTSAALAQSLGQLRGGNNTIQYSVNATAIRGQMVTTDSVMVFSASAEIDTQKAVAALNNALSGNSESLLNAYDQIAAFYEEQGKAMDELYAVFVNSKNYQLGGSHGSYKQHEGGPMETLPTFLEHAGVNVTAADEFLETVYNTGVGAIRENMRGEIIENATNAIKAAAAKLMFDDWQTLGTNTGHGIHMFLLSGKYIPSSVVFHALANAGDRNVDTKAHFYLPEAINDLGPDGWPGSNNVEIKEEIWQHWNEEFENAKKTARWSADFVINIKRIIG